MSSFALRLDKIEFINDVDRDSFLSAPNANLFPKLFYYFLEQGARWGQSNVSNLHLQNLMHASERAIQYVLQQMDDLGFITLQYEKERPSKLMSEYQDAQKVGKRIGIVIHLDEMLGYSNISRYDDEYKEAEKRGWLRRLINQIPIRIIGLFNHALAMAKKAHNEAKIEALNKRRENYNRHIKSSLKRHKRYMDITAASFNHQDDLSYMLEVATTLGIIGTKDLPGKLVIPPSEVLN